MNVGDIVKVTRSTHPDSCIEGELVECWKVSGYFHCKVCYLGSTLTVSTKDFDVKVIRRVEPVGVGATYRDEYNNLWTRWTERDTFERQWISDVGVHGSWKELME